MPEPEEIPEEQIANPIGPKSSKAIDEMFAEDPPKEEPPKEEPPKEEPPKEEPPKEEPPKERNEEDLFFDENKESETPKDEGKDAEPVPLDGDVTVLQERLKNEAFEKREFRRQAKEAAEKVKTLEQQLQEVESQLGQVDLSRSRAFKEKYDKPIRDLQDRIVDTLMTRTEDYREREEAASFARKILQAPSVNAVEDLLAGEVPGASVSVVGAVISRYEESREALSRRNTALEKWKETQSAITQEVEAEEFQRTREKLVEALQVGVDSAISSQNPVWVAAKEEQRAGLIASLTGVLEDNSPETIATQVAQGLTVPHLTRALDKMRSRIQTLEQENSELAGEGSASSGKPRGGFQKPSESGDGEAPEKTGAEIIDEMFPSSGRTPEPIISV